MGIAFTLPQSNVIPAGLRPGSILSASEASSYGQDPSQEASRGDIDFRTNRTPSLSSRQSSGQDPLFCDGRIEVLPFGAHSLDQPVLVKPFPPEGLVIDQQVEIVSLSESVNLALAVFERTLGEIARDTCVQRSPCVIRDDVDEVNSQDQS